MWTGSIACAIISSIKFDLNPPISILTKGGQYLSVGFTRNKEDFRDITLIGPTKAVFQGKVLFDTITSQVTVPE
jgi:hypothetical protein